MFRALIFMTHPYIQELRTNKVIIIIKLLTIKIRTNERNKMKESESSYSILSSMVNHSHMLYVALTRRS